MTNKKEQDNTTQEEDALQGLAESEEGLENQELAKISELEDKVLRLMAEVENTKRRGAKELEDMSKYGITKFARDLIEVFENLERTSIAIQKQNNNDAAYVQLQTGVDLVKKSLENAFAKHGIVRIDPMHQRFDHNLHQVIAKAPAADHASGVIIDVTQKGYLIHDRLLRPALVVVSSGPTE